MARRPTFGSVSQTMDNVCYRRASSQAGLALAYVVGDLDEGLQWTRSGAQAKRHACACESGGFVRDKGPPSTCPPQTHRRQTSRKGQLARPSDARQASRCLQRAGGDDEKAARILACSVGAARLARKRHLGSAAI